MKNDNTPEQNAPKTAEEFLKTIIDPTNQTFRMKVHSSDGLFTYDVETLTFPELLNRFASQFKSSQPSEVVLPNADNVNNLINHLGERLRKQRDILKNTQEVLSNVHQVLTGWHSDGTSWTEWDETTRKSVYDLQNEIEKHLSFIHKDEIQQSPPPTKEIGETLSKEILAEIIENRTRVEYGKYKDSSNVDFIKTSALKAAEAICSLAIPKGDDGWISVEDRLPEEKQDVLVIRFLKNKFWIPEVCEYSEDIFKGVDFDVDYSESSKKVTHWQPLPNPPKK